MQNVEMLTDEGKELYGKYRDGHRTFPDNHDENVRLEQAWVDRVLEKNQKRRHEKHVKAETHAPLFPRKQKNKEAIMTTIKKEKTATFWGKLRCAPTTGPISLDSPSPVKKKGRTDLALAEHRSRVDLNMSASSTAPAQPENPDLFGQDADIMWPDDDDDDDA
jgi:hypothetical protein